MTLACIVYHALIPFSTNIIKQTSMIFFLSLVYYICLLNILYFFQIWNYACRQIDLWITWLYIPPNTNIAGICLINGIKMYLKFNTVCPQVFSSGGTCTFYLHFWGYIQIFGGAMYPLTLHLGVQRKWTPFFPHKVVHHAVFCKY